MSEKPKGLRQTSGSRSRRKRNNKGKSPNTTDSESEPQTQASSSERPQRPNSRLEPRTDSQSTQSCVGSTENQSSRRLKGPREFGSPAIPGDGGRLQPFTASELKPERQRQRKQNRKAVKFDRTDEIIQYDALTPEPDAFDINRFEDFEPLKHQAPSLSSSFGISDLKSQELLSHIEPVDVPVPPNHSITPLGHNRPLPIVPSALWSPEHVADSGSSSPLARSPWADGGPSISRQVGAVSDSPLARSPWNDGGSSLSLQADLDRHRLSLNERVDALVDNGRSPTLPQSLSSFSINEQWSQKFDALPHHSLDAPTAADGLFGAEIPTIIASDADSSSEPVVISTQEHVHDEGSSDEYTEIAQLPNELVRKSSLRDWQKRPETKHISSNPHSSYVAEPKSELNRTHSMKRRSIIDLLNNKRTLEGAISEEVEREETSFDAMPEELVKDVENSDPESLQQSETAESRLETNIEQAPEETVPDSLPEDLPKVDVIQPVEVLPGATTAEELLPEVAVQPESVAPKLESRVTLETLADNAEESVAETEIEDMQQPPEQSDCALDHSNGPEIDQQIGPAIEQLHAPLDKQREFNEAADSIAEPLTPPEQHVAPNQPPGEASQLNQRFKDAASQGMTVSPIVLVSKSSPLPEVTKQAPDHHLEEYVGSRRDSTMTFDFSKPLDASSSELSSDYNSSSRFVMPENPLTSEPVLVPTLPLFSDSGSTTQITENPGSSAHFPVEVPVRPTSHKYSFDGNENSSSEKPGLELGLPELLVAPPNLNSETSSLCSVASNSRLSEPVDIRQQNLFDFETAGNSDMRKSVLEFPAPDPLADCTRNLQLREAASIHSLRDLAESLGGSGSGKTVTATFSDSDADSDFSRHLEAGLGDLTTDTQRHDLTGAASMYTASINEVDFVRMNTPEQLESARFEQAKGPVAHLECCLSDSPGVKHQGSPFWHARSGSVMSREHEQLILDSDLSDDEVTELEKGQNAAKALLAKENLQALPRADALGNENSRPGDGAPQISPMVTSSPKTDQFWTPQPPSSWAFAPRQTQSMDVMRASSPRTAQPRFASPQLNSDATFSPRIPSSTATSWRSSSSNRGLSKTGSVLSSEQSTPSVQLEMGESISSIHEDLNRMIPEEDFEENSYPRAQYTVRKSASIIRASSPPRTRGVVRAYSAEVKPLKQATAEPRPEPQTTNTGREVTRSSSFIAAPRGSKIGPSASQRARLNYHKLPEVYEAQEELQSPCNVPDARVCTESPPLDAQPKPVSDSPSDVDEQLPQTHKPGTLENSSPSGNTETVGRRAPVHGLSGEKGRLFLAIDQIDIPNIPSFVAENATMTMTIDNGIHCVTTPARSLKERINWGEEFELSICSDFSCIITLKLAWNDETFVAQNKSTDHASQKPAQGHKHKPSLLSRLGMKHSSEQSRQQQPTPMTNPLESPGVKSWLSRVAGDGTFGRYALHYSDFSQAALGRPLNILLTAGDRTVTPAPPQLKASLLFVPRVSSSEILPRTMSHAKHDLELAARNPHPALSGQLLQIGGDCTQPRRREVALDGGLLITHSASSGRPRVSINLTKCLDVVPLSNSNFDFYLRFRNGDELAFKVEFGPTCNQWISALIGVIGKPPSRAHWLSLALHGNDKQFASQAQTAVRDPTQRHVPATAPVDSGYANEIDLPKRRDKISAW